MNNSSGDEIAFVWGDGAIKGGFSAGAGDVAYRYVHQHGVKISAIMASSVSVGNMFYFLSYGDDHPGREMWTQTLSDPKFIKYDGLMSLYRDRPIYDIDYLVDTIFKHKYPLDVERIKKSKIRIFFPLQDYDTGEVVYFTNGPSGEFKRGDTRMAIVNIFDFDIYELIRAASAAPFVYDRTVKIGERRFIDAAAMEPFALDVPIVRDCKKIIILTKQSSNLDRFFSYLGLALFFVAFVRPFKSNKLKVRHYMQYATKALRMKKLLKTAQSLCRRGEAVLLVPTKNIGSNFDNTVATLTNNYLHGVAVAESAQASITRLVTSSK